MSADIRQIIARAIYEEPAREGNAEHNPKWDNLAAWRKSHWEADADRIMKALRDAVANKNQSVGQFAREIEAIFSLASLGCAPVREPVRTAGAARA